MRVTLCDTDGAALQGSGVASRTITAENLFTTGRVLRGEFNVSIGGIAGGTVVWVQRAFPEAPTTWLDITSFSANIQTTGYEPEPGVLYRIGVKTGGFGSGTASVRLSQ